MLVLLCIVYFFLFLFFLLCVFFFKQKTAYEMRISDWSSDVCSSDLPQPRPCICATSSLRVSRGVLCDRAGGHGCRSSEYLSRQQIGRASCRERVCQYV